MQLSYSILKIISLGAMAGIVLMFAYGQGYQGDSLELYAGLPFEKYPKYTSGF